MQKIIIHTLFLCVCNISFPQSPEFVIQTPSGGWHLYDSTNVNDEIVNATLTNNGDIWTLNLTANTEISKVLFPYESERKPLDNDITDDIVYYPFLSGTTEKATNINTDFNWWGATYPGSFFSPLIVVADGNNGRVIAATNWPAKRVTPYYAAERIMLEYIELNLQINDNISFSALIKDVTANTSNGEKAWRLALDPYKNWLNTTIPTLNYPTEMINMHGLFNIGLTDWPEFSLSEINATWIQWRDKLPWIQFWGQMSNYAGPPEFAVPPLLPGEVTDCCAANSDIHPRYNPSLIDFLQNSVINLGFRGGYYSSPYKIFDTNPPTRLLLDTQAGKDWLTNWVDKNETEYNANAFYLDIIGREYWGNPDDVIDVLNEITTSRPITFIEGLVDIYPNAGLISGSLIGDSFFIGGDGLTPENTISTTFPQFQRYVLNNHIAFLGPSNGDSVFMGPTADYWLERQTFLLGAKFEVTHPNDNWNPSTPNPILTLAIDKRIETNWWQRNPIYQDTKGITNIPNGIEIRRFIDSSNCDLFAIDNWNEIENQTFNFNGEVLSIPSSKLSIIETCILSINDYKEIDIKVYPNPATNSINLHSNILLNNTTLKVFNSLGQIVIELKDMTGFSQSINTEKLLSGMYFIKVALDKNISQTFKLIIE